MAPYTPSTCLAPKEECRLYKKKIILAVKYGGGSLIFWRCFAASGPVHNLISMVQWIQQSTRKFWLFLLRSLNLVIGTVHSESINLFHILICYIKKMEISHLHKYSDPFTQYFVDAPLAAFIASNLLWYDATSLAHLYLGNFFLSSLKGRLIRQSQMLDHKSSFQGFYFPSQIQNCQDLIYVFMFISVFS